MTEMERLTQLCAAVPRGPAAPDAADALRLLASAYPVGSVRAPEFAELPAKACPCGSSRSTLDGEGKRACASCGRGWPTASVHFHRDPMPAGPAPGGLSTEAGRRARAALDLFGMVVGNSEREYDAHAWDLDFAARYEHGVGRTAEILAQVAEEFGWPTVRQRRWGPDGVRRAIRRAKGLLLCLHGADPLALLRIAGSSARVPGKLPPEVREVVESCAP